MRDAIFFPAPLPMLKKEKKRILPLPFLSLEALPPVSLPDEFMLLLLLEGLDLAGGEAVRWCTRRIEQRGKGGD